MTLTDEDVEDVTDMLTELNEVRAELERAERRLHDAAVDLDDAVKKHNEARRERDELAFKASANVRLALKAFGRTA